MMFGQLGPARFSRLDSVTMAAVAPATKREPGYVEANHDPTSESIGVVAPV